MATPHMSDLTQNAGLITAIGEIPQKERKLVLDQAAPLLKGAMEDKGVIISAIAQIPKELRDERIGIAVSLMEGFDSAEERAALLVFTHKHGKTGVAAAAPLYEGIIGATRVKIFKAAFKIDPEQLEEIVSLAAPHLKEFNSSERPDIIKAIQRISQGERQDVLAKAALLKTGDKHSFDKIIDALSAFPQDQRAAIFVKMSAFLEGIASLHERASIIRAIKKIPQDQRDDVLTRSQNLAAGNKYDVETRVSILQTIRDIAREQREDVMAKAAPLIKVGTDWEKKQKPIFEAISQIPPDQRENVIAEAAPLFSGENRGEILSGVAKIRPGQRGDVVAKAIPLIEGMTYPLQRVYVLSAVSEIDQDQRESLIAMAKPLLATKERLNRYFILRAINKIKPEERQGVLELAIPLIKRIKKNPDGLIAAVARFLQNGRTGFAKQIMDVMGNVWNKELFVDLLSRLPEPSPEAILAGLNLCQAVESIKVGEICKRFDYIPPQDLPTAVRYLTENPAAQVSSLFGYLIAEDPNFHTRCGDYLAQKLSAIHEHRIQAFYLAELIVQAPIDVMIDQSHPLFLHAYAVYATANPSLQNDRKNAYTLFCQLKKTADEPFLPCDTPVSDGVKIDMEKCREAANRKPLTYADLPTIDKKLPMALLSRLNDRPKITAYLKEINLTLEVLEGQLFGSNSLIPRLLSAGAAHAIRNDHYYLYTIIKALSEASSEGDPSEQEEMLMKFGVNLHACSTGQSDAIALYYNALPIKYRTNKGQEGEMEKVRSLIDASVQNQLNNILSDVSLLKELLAVDGVAQISHQTMYIKNRLWKQVGLKHEVTLDSGSFALYDSLLDIPVDALLAPVIKRCTSDAFIGQVQRVLNGVITEDPAQMHHLLVYVQNAIPKITAADLFEDKKLTLDELQNLFTYIQNKFPETQSVNISGQSKEQLHNLFKKIVDDNLHVETDPRVVKNLTALTRNGAKQLLLASGYLK